MEIRFFRHTRCKSISVIPNGQAQTKLMPVACPAQGHERRCQFHNRAHLGIQADRTREVTPYPLSYVRITDTTRPVVENRLSLVRPDGPNFPSFPQRSIPLATHFPATLVPAAYVPATHVPAAYFPAKHDPSLVTGPDPVISLPSLRTRHHHPNSARPSPGRSLLVAIARASCLSCRGRSRSPWPPLRLVEMTIPTTLSTTSRALIAWKRACSLV
jgi:hypothetical protein